MKVWLPLGALYAVFVIWYGGFGSPLSEDEVQRIAQRLEAVAPTPELAARLLEFARADDGREFFMVNLNRHRAEPRYADGRDPGGASAEEVERRYTSRMVPRLPARACHPWIAVEPILALTGDASAPEYDRATLVRYRSRRDFLDIVATDDWREDAKHKWAALEVAYSLPAQPAIVLPGPRAAVLGILFALGVALRTAGRRRNPR
ncbi:MAG: hypothetical protein ABFS41_04560 [Myxococcota bacterium]